MTANRAEAEHSTAWYVAYTEPRQEHLARSNLQQQGFVTYLPLYKKTGKKAAAKLTAAAAHEAMFPRYLFFKPSNIKQSISTVRSTRGINSIVRFGTTLAQVSPEIVASIEQHERERNRESQQGTHALKAGRRVRFSDPALKGLEGLVHSVSTQRVIVLMEILGRQARIKLPIDHVEPT
ncbi:transcriptional activator RfaH [Candidimonas sp. SYP-B2681]|nr:transcriptional activator RfaH [Candidimonas sp. SYP-B2681]